ncbi:MAG: response regulator transcription factor [Treponema sp.]|nr:response regulator transcription factor [Treponema sp.]
MSISVFIIDDHPLFSRGLAQLIETENGYKVVGMAKDRTEALEYLSKKSPDLIILDLNLGKEDGLEVLKEILYINSKIKVLILSMHDERFYAERAIKAGAKGYIMKAEAESKVLDAISTVCQGKIYLSENEKNRVKSEGDSEDNVSFISTLSDRQLQIFTLIGKGIGTMEMADKLNVSIKTIDTHKENMKSKLHCKSSAELRQMAIEWVSKMN